ncbi:MAG: MFS transporter [Bacteroidia bacterium]|nr:MFS transporter [Bacteroidia bacterium]
MHRHNESSIWTRDFIMLALANFLMAIAFYFLISTLPVYIVRVLKTSKSEAGLILASYTIAALIIRPVAGYACDNIGRKWIYIISLFLFSLLFNTYIWATTIAIMLMLRFIHGLAWGFTSTSGSTLAVDMIPPSKRGEGIGIYGLSMTIAMAIGPVVGLAISKGDHFNNMFITGGALSLAGLVLALMIKYPAYQPHKVKFHFRNLLEKKSLPISFNQLMITISYGGLLSFIAIYGKETGIANPGIFFIVYAVGIAVSRVISGKIFDKYGPKTIVSIGILLIIIGFPILALEQNYAGFLISAGIMGLGNGVVSPNFQAMINNMVESHRRGAANSTLMTAFDMGVGLGMIISGILSDRLGLSGSFLISAGINGFALCYFWLYALKHYQKHMLAK